MGRRFWLGTATCMLVGAASVAQAGGYEIPENNPRALGRGGANIAHVQDASATYFNPGALSRLDSFHFSGGLNFPLQFSKFQRADFVFPDAGIDQDLTIKYTESRNSLGALPAPALFIAHDFGLKNTSFGLGLYGPSATPQMRWDRMDTSDMIQPGGDEFSDTETTRKGGHAYMIEDADLIVLYPSLTASHYFENINLGIGASLQLVYASTKVRLGLDGLTGVGINPNSMNDTQARTDQNPNGVLFDEDPASFVETRVNTSGFGVTGNFGFVWDPIPQVSVGVSYRPAHRVRMKGNFSIIAPKLEGMGLNLVDDHAEMDIVMPHVLRAGVNYRHIVDDFEVFDIELAATYEMWSIVDKMTAKTPGPVNTDGFSEGPRPIANVDIPFNFKNTVSLRLGGDYNGLRNRSNGQGVTLRGGLFWESNGVSNPYSHLMFMPFGRIGLSAGFSYHFKQERFSQLSLDFGALWLHNFTRTVTDGKMNIIAPLWICHNGENVPSASKEDIMAACEADAAAGNSPYHAVNNGTYKTDFLTLSVGVTYAF